MAFSSSSLRLRFIFLSLASLIVSLYSFLALPFLSLLFYFCLEPCFCLPYHCLPWPMPSSSISVRNPNPSIFFLTSDVVYTNFRYVRVRNNCHTEESLVYNSGIRRGCTAFSFQFLEPHYQVCSFYSFRFSYFAPLMFCKRIA